MDSLSISDPRRVPALPLRPSWLVEEAMNHDLSISNATKELMKTWNAWVDCVEKVFQKMGNQTVDLDISEDKYISFIRKIASHPARPTQRPLADITEHEEWFMTTMPCRYLTHLHVLWNAYADKLEETYNDMAAEPSRCNLLAPPFETTSTRGQLHGIFCSMLGPGRLFHGPTETRAPEMSLQRPSNAHADQLVSGIENMSLHEVAEELVVRLQNMNIETHSF